MMKSFFAILLAALLALTGCAALAEETVQNEVYIDFNIRMDKLPEGYAYQTEEGGGSIFAVFYNESDENAPIIYVSVAYSEELDGQTLDGQISEEELQTMESQLAADYNEPIVEIRETDYGTKLICIAENDAQTDYADMITIWHGYIITVGLQKTEQLTDADMELATQIVSDLWIVQK